MSQNIYDDETFFKIYSLLPRSKKGYEFSYEWPYIKSLLPNIENKKVLDLGCGYGWFCREALKMGCEKVWGFDISKKMLTKAKEFDTIYQMEHPNVNLSKIVYVNQDLEDANFNDDGLLDFRSIDNNKQDGSFKSNSTKENQNQNSNKNSNYFDNNNHHHPDLVLKKFDNTIYNSSNINSNSSNSNSVSNSNSSNNNSEYSPMDINSIDNNQNIIGNNKDNNNSNNNNNNNNNNNDDSNNNLLKFDFALGVFIFHYIKNIEDLFQKIFNSLNKGGCLVFSVEHPIYMASKYSGYGWIPLKGNEEELVWPVSHYSYEGERTRTWLGVEGIKKQHRTIGTYINLLIKVGFTIEHVNEWSPNDSQIRDFQLLSRERERPIVLIIKATK